KDAKNCSVAGSGSAVVTIIPAPTATLSGSATLCPAGGSVSITPVVNGNFPMTLVWSDGFTQTVTAAGQARTVSPAATTTYTITSFSLNGCTGTSSGSAVVAPQVVTITTQPASVTVTKNATPTLSVTASSTGSGTVLHYQWYKGASGTTTTPVGTDSRT